jgi:hypothetical protein
LSRRKKAPLTKKKSHTAQTALAEELYGTAVMLAVIEGLRVLVADPGFLAGVVFILALIAV